LQANKRAESMCRVARALGTVQPILDNFDKDNSVAKPSSAHQEVTSLQDFKAVLECLNKVAVFEKKNG